MEFIKGYIFGKSYSCDEYLLETGDYEYGGVVYMEGYNYPYWRVSKSWLDQYNDPTKREIRTWVEDGKPQCEFVDPVEYIDHHNYLFEDGACAIGETPQEALRQYILNVYDKNLEAYVRKDNKFIYLNDYAADRYKWDELFDGVDRFFLYAKAYPYNYDCGLEMTSFIFGDKIVTKVI